MAKKENTQEIGFEHRFGKPPTSCVAIWMHRNTKALCWGLIFLKYISDKFEERYFECSKRAMGSRKIATNTPTKHLFRPPGSALVDNCGAGSYAGDWQSDR